MRIQDIETDIYEDLDDLNLSTINSDQDENKADIDNQFNDTITKFATI